jgi:alpha-methylacyl-CoA racemase
MKEAGFWNGTQGQNLLDGGAPFYSVYQSKDKKYFAVGCLEPQFYNLFISVIPTFFDFL